MNTKKRLSEDLENTKEVLLEQRFVTLNRRHPGKRRRS